MTTRMLIDATHPEETRVVVVRGNRIEDFDFESASKKQLKGNIYLAKVTRVEPSLQAAFVEYGGNRHGFLAFSEIHPDYYQIPIADRQALLAQQAEDAARAEAEADRAEQARARRREEQDAGDHAGSGDEDEFHGHIETVEGEDDTETIDGGPSDLADDEDGEDEAPRRPSLALDVDHAPEPVLAGPAPEADSTPQAEAVPEADGTADAPAEVSQAEGAAGDPSEASAQDASPSGIAAEAPVTAQADAAPASDEAQPAVEPAAQADAAREDEPAAVEARSEDGQAENGPAADNASAYSENADSDTDSTESDSGESDSGDSDSSDTESGESRPPRRSRYRSARAYKIQEVIKRRQILLVQVVKEERGNKGAALTTYISLAGRYCVLMPNTSRGGGISRKIVNPADRKRLKEITADLEIQDGMGVIVRTAGLNRTKPEIKRDFEYLLRLWDSVRQLTLQSSAPALVYEEGDLIKRVIRDMYSKDIEEILVEGEESYRQAKDFMRMLIPSHARNVQPYRERVPLFHRFQVEQQLDQMFNPVVQLKSGGYIVINQTEALVAIDVNSGRSTREHNIEETATKTNLEASEEIARQLRLRDLAGLVVIDFIDMEDQRNNRAVEKKLKESLKADRARIQIGRISPFGLLELSRQRLHPGLIEASTDVCPHCAGVGRVRSIESSSLHVLRAVEDEGVRERSAAITVRCATPIALYILNQKRAALRAIEERYGLEVMVDADPALIPPAFRLERLRPRTADAPPPVAIRHGAVPMIDYDDEDEPIDDAVALESEDEDTTEAKGAEARSGDRPSGERPSGDKDSQGEDRRGRRRRRRRGGARGEPGSEGEATARGSDSDDDSDGQPGDTVPATGRGDRAGDDEAAGETTGGETGAGDGSDEQAESGAGGEPERRRRRRSRRGGRRNGGAEGEARPPQAWPDETAVAVVPADESWPDLGETLPAPADGEPVFVSESVALLVDDEPAPHSEASLEETVQAETERADEPRVDMSHADTSEDPAPEVLAEAPAAPKAEAVVAETPAEVAPVQEMASGVTQAQPEPIPADTAPDTFAEVPAEEAQSAAPEPEPQAAPVEATAEPAVEAQPEPQAPAEPEAPKGPPRRGWWQRRLGG